MTANRGFSVSRRWLREDAAANVALTPLWLVSEIRAVLGGIDVDPCTTAANPTSARFAIAPPRDGALEPWPDGTAFVNPPFSALERWSSRVDEEAASGRRMIALAPAHTETSAFARLGARASDIVLVQSRVVFDGGRQRVHRRTTANGAPAVAIAIFGYGVELASFAHLGLVASPRACATAAVSPFRRPAPVVSLAPRGDVNGHGYGYAYVAGQRLYFGPCTCGTYVLATDAPGLTFADVAAVRAEIERRYGRLPCGGGCLPGGRRASAEA